MAAVRIEIDEIGPGLLAEFRKRRPTNCGASGECGTEFRGAGIDHCGRPRCGIGQPNQADIRPTPLSRIGG